MKIALTGTQSVGKTELVKELSKLPQFKDYFIVTERSKYLRDKGIKLNDDSTIKGQMVFAAERSMELMNENLLTDRSIYDVVAFTGSSKTISWPDKGKLIKSFLLLSDEYDLIIYINPEGTTIEDNGVREINPEYRQSIDNSIKLTLEYYPPKKLIEVKGSTEERIQMILPHIY
jgi:nicotinamide riboside kinase